MTTLMSKKHSATDHDLTKVFSATQKFVCSMMLLFLLTAVTGQKTMAQPPVYVNAAATGLNDGTSWENAYTSLQDGIDNCIWGNVLVWRGTYKPTKKFGGTGTRNAAFQLKNNVQIVGGFGPGSNSITDRSNYRIGEANETILSGDIGIAGVSSDNCYHVIYNADCGSLNSYTSVDGFTIRGGNANSTSASDQFRGGGIYNDELCNPTFNNCTFVNNTAGYGGAFYTTGGGSNLNKCIFTQNNANAVGSDGGSGGAIYITTMADVKISQCLIYENTAQATGGGIYVYSSTLANRATVDIKHTTIANNHADLAGGIRLWDYSKATIFYCIIYGNTHHSTAGQQISVTSDSDCDITGSCHSISNAEVTSGTWVKIYTRKGINPEFLNPAVGNFRIGGNSIAVDIPDYPLTDDPNLTDLRGQKRVQGPAPDCGPYEYTPGVDPVHNKNAAFTTEPIVLTEANRVTVNSAITYLGETITQHGHVWSTVSTFTDADNKTQLGVKNATGAFSSTITPLYPGTTYYIAPYATTSAGTYYGITQKVAMPIVRAHTSPDSFTNSFCQNANNSIAYRFWVSGTNLLSDIHITAPSGFRISKYENGDNVNVNTLDINKNESSTLIYLTTENPIVSNLAGNIVISSTATELKIPVNLTVNESPKKVFKLTGGGNYCPFDYKVWPIVLEGSEIGVDYVLDGYYKTAGTGSAITLPDRSNEPGVHSVMAYNTTNSCPTPMNGTVIIDSNCYPLLASPVSLNFGKVGVGNTSACLTYTLSGKFLYPATGTIAVTAPSGFKISLNSNFDYDSSILLPYSGSTISTVVYVIFQPTELKDYNEHISFSGVETRGNVRVMGDASISYCEASSEQGNEYISRVQLNSIDMSSTYTTGGYSDYSNIKTQLLKGTSNQITVTNSTASYTNDQCKIWIDWNNDGTFTDVDESITVNGSPGTGSYTATIEPPFTAVEASVRMRIRIANNTAPLPCGLQTRGETEDYTITVALSPNPPTIAETSLLRPFATCMGSTSTPQSLTVSGSCLVGNLSILAPAGFEISANALSGYAGSLVLSPAEGTIASKEIFVRIASTATDASLVNLLFTSAGAVSRTVPLSGTIHPLPIPTITGPTTATINSTGNVYATQEGMTSYNWTISGGTITAGGNSTSNTATVTWNSSGAKTIHVGYTNSNSCTSASPGTCNVTVNSGSSPNISITSALLPFNYCAGSASEEQSFTVTGSNLSGNIIITPPTGFEVRSTSESYFLSSNTLIPEGGSVSTKTIYVRVASNATGTVSGDISITSAGISIQNLNVMGNSGGASFYTSGSTFSINLSCSSRVSIVSTGTSYIFSLGSGEWSGAATGASVSGKELTISSSGLSAYSTFEITDNAPGAGVTFNNSSSNIYNDHFTIALNNQAEAVIFNGTSAFSGSNSISLSTDKNILFNSGSSLTTIDGALSLSANMQETTSTFSESGIDINNTIVQSTGTGAVTLRGRSGNGASTSVKPGISIVGGKLLGGTSGLLTVEGFGTEANDYGNNIGISLKGNSLISSLGCAITITGTGGGVDYTLGGNHGIYVESGKIIGASGMLAVNGKGGNKSGVHGANHGVYILNNTSIITSTSGNVMVTGTGGGEGGASGSNKGVYVSKGGVITSDGSASTVTVLGTGGNSSGGSNCGVEVSEGTYTNYKYTYSTITSVGGEVSITGKGSGAGANNYGVYIFKDSQITSGYGNVAVTGTGGGDGGSGYYNIGVKLETNGNIYQGSSASSVTVIGTGGSSSSGYNSGVVVSNSRIGFNLYGTSGSGSVTVSGNGGGSGITSNNYGVYLLSSEVSSGGMLTVRGNGGNNNSGRFGGNHGIYLDVNSRIGANCNVLVTGTGGGKGSSGSDNYGVYLNTGCRITNYRPGKTVTIEGIGGNSTGNSNYGVNLSGGSTDMDLTEITSGGGAVSVTGTGGGSGPSNTNYGIAIFNIGLIDAPSTGSVTVNGRGGNNTIGGTGGQNHGVFIDPNRLTSYKSKSQITSTDGYVSVTGTGGGDGGSGSNNSGVYLTNSGSITSGVYLTYSGSITPGGPASSVLVRGTGGNSTGSDNYGVHLASYGRITSGGTATVTVEGTGSQSSGANNNGVFIEQSSIITSGGGNVIVSGTEGKTSNSYAIHMNEGEITTATLGGSITLIGNSFDTYGMITTNPDNSISLIQQTDGLGFDIENKMIIAGGPIRPALHKMSTGILNIGNAQTGNITLGNTKSSLTERKTKTKINLCTSAASAVIPVVFDPLGNLTTDKLTFTSGTNLNLSINGKESSLNQYDDLTVIGDIDLSGSELKLSGAYIPQVGDIFKIVIAVSTLEYSNSTITGTFNSLPDNSLITFNGRTLHINYTATEVTLTTIAFPTIAVPSPASLSEFTTSAGVASASQSFTTAGNMLTANMVINAPTGFEISRTQGSGYTSSLTLTQSDGTVASTTIYVRMANTASGNPSGNITLTSTGATPQNLPVSGTVSEAVSSVSVPENNTYRALQNLDFTVNYTSAITVTGAPSIPLTLGIGGVVNASYFSGSGTNALIFRYTIANGNADNDGVSLGSTISLNGGSMKNSLGTNAILSLNNIASTSGILVDAIAPTVTITSTSSATTSVSPIPVTLEFSEPVTGFVTGEISVTNGTAGNFSGSGITYTANITPSGPGTVTVNIAASMAMDAAGNNNTAATQLSRIYIMAPSTTTNAASSITSTIATFNGSVNANNSSTAVTFEYGTTTGYGSTVTADQSPVTGLNSTSVSKAITGLAPNTTYHFRVKGVNTAGTTYGLDQTFTTVPLITLTVTGTLNPFASCQGSNSSEQSFTVSGTTLSGNISISAPTGFGISTTSGSNFSESLTLTQSGGTVASTTIYVRMESTATGSPGGSISVISSGATDQTVAVSGTVTTPVTPSFLVTTVPATRMVCAGSPVTLTASDVNNDLSFDGTNDFVNLGDVNELDGATQFTIEAMVYATSSSQYKTIFSKRADHYQKIQIYFGISGQLIFAIGNGNVMEASMTSMPLNNWSHIAAVYNASGATNADKMKLYLNGVQKTLGFSGTMPASIAVNSLPALIGSESVSPLSAVCYAGKMNDFRIWNTARSAAQLSASANSCLSGATTGLLAEYKFNEATGSSIAHNSHASAYQGTLVNMNTSTVWNASTSGCATDLNFAWSDGITNGVPFIPTNSGTYTLTATSNGICQNTATEPVEITVLPLPVPAISGNDNVLIGSTGNVYTTEPGMSGYTWSVSAGGIITSGGTSTSNTATITWNSAGDKTVGVNYTNINGCRSGSPTLFDVLVNSGPPSVVSLTGSMLPFAYCAGSVSQEQSFTVSGTNLTGEILITAPTGFEISTDSGSGFDTDLTLAPIEGTVSATTIYSRISATASGTVTGNITVASNSATTQNLAVGGYSTGAAFYASGSTFTVKPGCSATVAVASAGTSYTFTLSSGSWMGTAVGASASGNVLTISSTGLSTYDNFEITDGSPNAVVTFANSGSNNYSDHFNVLLNDQAGAVAFNGTSRFTGSNGISITTDRNIVFNSGSMLTTVDGALTLSANMQLGSSTFSNHGIEVNNATVEATGSGVVTVRGRAGNSVTNDLSGIYVIWGGKISGGTSGTLTVEGLGAEINTDGMFNSGVKVAGTSAIITSRGANVSISGTGGGTGSTSSSNFGVHVNYGGIISSGGNGNVTVTGSGSTNVTSYNNNGVVIWGDSTPNSAVITSGGSGMVTVTGNGGGSSSASDNSGIFMAAGGAITSGSGGSVEVFGNGNNTVTGHYNFGIRLENGKITCGPGNGSVTVTGTGGGSGNSSNNYGLAALDTQGSTITSGGNGTVSVTGYGGNLIGSGYSNHGINLQTDIKITSGGGHVYVKGIEGGSSNSYAIRLASTASLTTTDNGGNLTISGNSMNFDALTTIASNSGNILWFKEMSDEISFELGSASNDVRGGPIRLSNAEFAHLSGGRIQIGDDPTGGITIGDQLNSTSSLRLSTSNGVVPSAAGTDLTMPGKTLDFNSGTPLKITINGTIADTQYNLLNVSGTVDLTGAALVLDGSYTSVVDNIFGIVTASNILGNFNGLPEGSLISFNGRTLLIHYTATSVTLQDMLAPSINSFNPVTGGTGTTITITGNHFTEVTAVSFGGIAASSFSVLNSTTITAVVGAGTSGNVSVSSPPGTDTESGFTFIHSWSGAFNTDWNNPANWIPNTVPLAGTNVMIQNVVTDPIVSGGGTAYCNNLIIETGAVLTVAPGEDITISGTLTNNSAGGIVIQSNASGTGSLITGAAEGPGTTIANCYITSGRWQMVSSPVKGQTIAEFLSTNNNVATSGSIRGMMDYDPAKNIWNAFFSNSTEGKLGEGKGFSMRVGATSAVVTFSGSLQAGVQSVSGLSDYWNCIGNPYTSAVGLTVGAPSATNFLSENLNKFIPEFAAIYVWEQPDASNGQMGKYSVYNNTSGFVVQQGQSFFIKMKSNSMDFTPAMQLHNPDLHLKSTKGAWPSITLLATVGSQKSSTQIAFNNQMTNGLDVAFDAGLLKGSSDLLIYSFLVENSGNPFAIQALPDTYSGLVIPLGLDFKTGGEVVFSSELMNLPSHCMVILEDRENKTFTDLSYKVYKTSVAPNSILAERFRIHTSQLSTGLNMNHFNSLLSAYAIRNIEIVVKGEVSNHAIASLYDIQGRLILTGKLEAGNLNSLKTPNICNGIYMLIVKDKEKMQSFKIPIKE